MSYNSNGVNFNTLFEPGTTAALDYSLAGTNLSQLYASLARDQQIPDIGYREAGTDLARILMGNSAQYTTTLRITDTRNTAWNNSLTRHFSATFATTQQRTDFFTYGGRLIMSFSRTGGSASLKNTDWSILLSDMGTIELGKTGTYRNYGSVISGTGYDSLTTGYSTLYSASGTGPYTTNQILIQARLGINANVVEMRAILTDGTSNIVDESVDGTLTSLVTERRHPTVTAPTYANITLLSAGS